ncbi:type II toxin-antitoxin system VapB family antitoxin [Agrobacterium sp. ES01]
MILDVPWTEVMLMRTNIEMDDDLLEEVMALTRHATK